MLTIALHADFFIFINLLQLSRLCLFSLFASFNYIFFLVLFSYYIISEKRTKWSLI